VQALLGKGADVNAKNKDGETPLDMAKKEDRKDVIQILEGAGR
jgi:ankyrin repeat protein